MQFFFTVVPENFGSAVEQWNEETRSELIKKLQKELNFFVDTK